MYKSDFGFLLTKRRQKKTRDEFNSGYEKNVPPTRGWVLFKWPILAIFVKKKSVFFQFEPCARARAARARANRGLKWKKMDFF